MYTVVETDEFADWLAGLKDAATRVKLGRRVNKVKRGLLGDVDPVGEGVFEMREHFGPGWRMYYIKQGTIVIVMVGGGEKSSQPNDIKLAQRRAKELQ